MSDSENTMHDAGSCWHELVAQLVAIAMILVFVYYIFQNHEDNTIRYDLELEKTYIVNINGDKLLMSGKEITDKIIVAKGLTTSGELSLKELTLITDRICE